MPVPDRDCTVGAFVALLVKDRLPEAAPLAVGVKVSVTGADVPAASVTGNVIPESANSLGTLADEMVTDAPVAFKLPVSEELEPTTTLPKLREAGDTANWPAAVPVPESAMESGELEAFETIETLPLAALALVGAKVTENVTLWVDGSVMGKVNPVTEKDVPVTLAADIVTEDPPVLVTVSDLLLVLPT